ncbi:MAG: CpaF family protein [Anaerolineae bacterium]|nr:CpaF family protein [Anaerolineae bacterium]
MSLLKRLEGNGPKEGGNGAEVRPDAATRARRLQPNAPLDTRDAYRELKSRIQSQLIGELEDVDLGAREEVESRILEHFDNLLAQEKIILSRTERVRMFDQIVSEILGFGPLDILLEDPSVSEIMVNGPDRIYVERSGRIVRTDLTFESVQHELRIIERIVSRVGRRIDESSPMVDARLPDGSRVNAVIQPVSLVGPVLTIRKFSKKPLSAADLVRFGSLTSDAVQFLQQCVRGRLNILIAGGTGSGKTTLLNVISSFVPPDERIVTIENVAELQLQQEHVVTLETRERNIEGRGEISIRDLVVNALRMRPDRIIVGEVRAGESLDMLQAMNTGHDGSMTTLHANSTRDALARLETMVLMAGMDLPLRAIREQIASAIDLVVFQERLRDGSRRVVTIAEVQGLESDVIVMQDVFRFDRRGEKEGHILGTLEPTGVRPGFAERLEASGITIPPSLLGIHETLRRS